MRSDIVRVVIVDDHMVVRKGISYVFETADDIELVGEAESGEEAISLAKSLRPDIVLMDVQMEGIGGIETTRILTQHYPGTSVIGLSTFSDDHNIQAMMDAGARAYLRKDVDAHELLNALRKVYAGETIEPKLEGNDLHSAPASVNALSDVSCIALGGQQKKVLALMTKGFTNPEIAVKLDISRPTASYHVSAILRKLDVSNRAEAVAAAVAAGIVRPEDFDA